MTPKDYVLIDMAETSIKTMDATVCIVSLCEDQDSSFMIHAVSPVKRRDQLVLGLAPDSKYLTYRCAQDEDLPVDHQVFRDRELLRSMDQNLNLPEPLVSALQIPLLVEDSVKGFLVFGEMRNWERAPFTNDKIEQATDQAGKIEDYLEREYFRAS